MKRERERTSKRNVEKNEQIFRPQNIKLLAKFQLKDTEQYEANLR